MIFNLGGGGVTNANQLNYDNSKSGLESTDVQGALDEVTESLNNYDVEVIANIRKGVTTAQTINVPNLSQYKEILLCLRSDGDTEEGMTIYGIETIPYNLFKKGMGIQCRRYIGNDITVYIEYLSDTSILMSAHSAFGAIAYGVK